MTQGGRATKPPTRQQRKLCAGARSLSLSALARRPRVSDPAPSPAPTYTSQRKTATVTHSYKKALQRAQESPTTCNQLRAMQEGLKARGNNTHRPQTGQMGSEPAAEPYQVAPPMEIPGVHPQVCEYLRILFTLNHKLQKQLQEQMIMMQCMSAQMELLSNRKKRAREGDDDSETPTKVAVQEHPGQELMENDG